MPFGGPGGKFTLSRTAWPLGGVDSEKLLAEALRILGGTFHVGGAVRQRNRWHTAKRPLARGGDRARIVNVVAEVRAVVDARDDEVGSARQEVLQEEGDVDTVGRSSIHRPNSGFDLTKAQGVMKRDRVALRALLSLGGDRVDVCERRECLPQGDDARRVDPIVVGNQEQGSVRHAVLDVSRCGSLGKAIGREVLGFLGRNTPSLRHCGFDA